MKKKMWHCKYCGNTQDASESICRSCGNDLVIYGDIVFTDTSDAPVSDVQPGYQQGVSFAEPPVNQQGINCVNPPVNQQGVNYGGTPGYQQQGGFGGYQQGMNSAEKPFYPQDIHYGFDDNNNGKKENGGKKGIIALVAVALVAVVAVVTVLLLIKGKDDRVSTTKYVYPSTTSSNTTTTKPTTTKPTPVTAKAKIPDFGAFAANHTVSSDKNKPISGKTVVYSEYKIKNEMTIDVAWDYIELLRDYDFEFKSEDAFNDDGDIIIVGQYHGSVKVSSVTYTLEDGTVYEGEIIISITNNKASDSVVMVFYNEGFELCTPSRKTSVAVFDSKAAILPDYEKFADGRAEVYYNEYDAEEDIYTFEYEVKAADFDIVLDEYFDLLEDTYAYSINNRYDDYSWAGLAYTGNESIGNITTTFGDGSKFYNDAVTIDVNYYDDCIIVEISYVGDIELVTPKYTYDDTY